MFTDTPLNSSSELINLKKTKSKTMKLGKF